MKKILVSIIVLAVVGLAFVFGGTKEVVVAEEFGSSPRIEVVSKGVYLKTGEDVKSALVTGEVLSIPSTLETDATGVAIIHFPDGSEARLDPSGSLTIAEGSYDSKSTSIKVRLSLSAGRVWSKVVDLATTESRWQVETAHTVATVRGTAFGVEASEKRSAVLGSQHKVAVAPKDPKTGQVIKEREILVSEKQYVEVNSEGKGTPVVKASELKSEVATWAQQNEKEDRVIDVHLERRDLPREEIRRELLQNVIQRFEADKVQRETAPGEEGFKGEVPPPAPVGESREPKPLLEANVETAPKTVASPRVAPKPETTSVQTKIVVPTTVRTTDLAIKEIVVVPERKLITVDEDQVVSLKAFVIHPDGTRVDATSRVIWKVVGEIGFMKAPGVFVGKLSDQVSELGQAKGAVVATLKDLKTGEEHLGKTEIFEVRAVVVEETNLQG